MKGVPDILYKFFSPSAACHTISKGQIRFSRADRLNDPFEFLPRYDALTNDIDPNEESDWAKLLSPGELAEIQQSPEYKKGLEVTILEAERSTALKNQKEFANRFGFISFCERISSPVMWGHYCKDHTGFTIGLNTNHKFFTDLNYLVGMEYEKERPQFHNPSLPSAQETIRSERLLRVKNQEWSYEQEWRLYTNFDESGQTGDHKFQPFPFDALAGIYFGFRSSDSLVHAVIRELSKQTTTTPACYRMRPHRTEFELEPNPI